MIIPPARTNPSRRATAKVASMPAPVGGWNARDGLAQMKKDEAVELENYFPNTTSVDLRRGSERHAESVGRVTAFTRASTATWIDGTGVQLHTAAIDEMRFAYVFDSFSSPANTRPLIEAAATNRVLHNRDLTNAAWTATNATVTHNQTGLDGNSNSASLVTSTASGATVTQSITDASKARVVSVWIKFVSGTGLISVTTGAGDVLAFPTAGVWVRIQKTVTSSNPTVGIYIHSSGSSFVIDYFQEEDGATATSAIPTAGVAVTRAADVPTYSSGSSATVAVGNVETLMSYASGTALKLLAASGGGVYDITTDGPVSTPLVTGMTNNRWSYVNFKDVIVMVNGADTPRKYDGSTISTTSITGVTSTTLSYVTAHKNRLWFIEKNTLSAWYLATNAITGAATEFDLTNFFKLGGYLVALGTWTRDGGDGMDDFFVFITNKGEVAVYQGTDPSSANTWSLVGIFRIGAPIGNRPLVKVGSDLAVICEDGLVSLATVLPLDRVGAARGSITDKIRDAFAVFTRAHRDNFGWQAILHPQSNWLLVNVPTGELTSSEQCVMNTITGAWCKFIGWTAFCWELHDNEIYFGTDDGVVMKADVETRDDNGGFLSGAGFSNIVGTIRPSFQYFGGRSSLKHFKMARPVISSDIAVDIATRLNTDFADNSPTAISSSGTEGAVWDESPWDTTAWGSSSFIRKGWLSTTGIGYCGSLTIRTSTKYASVSLHSIDYAYEEGGVV